MAPTTPTKKSGRKSAEQKAAEDAAAQLEAAQEAMRAAQAAMEGGGGEGGGADPAKDAEAEGGGGPPEGPDRVSSRSGPVRSELTPRSDPCDNCRHAEAACEWFTDKSQAVSCLHCQGYKKPCRG